MPNPKILGGLLGAVLLCLMAAVLALWLWVSPNQYKSRIVAAVRQSTGRDLQLPGDIKLSLFPWPALELGPASLGNPAGFAAGSFLSIDHASLRVRLLALLERRLEVSRIDIDGLEVRLLEDAQGRGNWQSSGGDLPRAEPEPGSPAPSDADRQGGTPSLQSFADLRVRHGRISYRDIVIGNLDFESGSPEQGRDIPVSATFDVDRGPPGGRITVNAKFEVSGESVAAPLHLAAVNLNGTVQRPDDARAAHWDFTAPTLDVNPAQQSLQAAAFTLSYSMAHLSGSVAAKNLPGGLSVTGSMTLAPLVLREFAPRFNVALPQTSDAQALSELSGQADVVYETNALRLSNLVARLDDTQWQGNLSYSSTGEGALEFDLKADQLDLDRYRGPGTGQSDHEPKPQAQAADAATAPNAVSAAAKPFEAAGTLTVASAKFLGKDLSHLHLTVASKDRLTHFFPVEADIDGGHYSGDITLDDRGAVRIVSLDEHLVGVDLARLLGSGAPKRHLSGRATVSFRGDARGATADAWRKTLSGQLRADLKDGAYEGIDLGYDVNRAQALIDGGTAQRADTGRTAFDQFSFSAEVSNGIAQTQDLLISSPPLRVRGQGSANLSTKALNFQLLASLFKAPATPATPANAPATPLIEVPVQITGTYADPTVKADISAVAKDALKQKLKDILKKNGLQGLFGK